MSTPAFRKCYFALASLGTMLLAGLLIFVLLQVMTVKAERDLGVFPFKESDWNRFLLHSQFTEQEKPVLMLMGPSQVRENLRAERFADAFPGVQVRQGGLSLGTIEDAEVALRFIELAYGEAALPDFVIIGTSPRFLANIPSNRPFQSAINSYSGWSVETDGEVVTFQKESWPKALVAHAKFIGQQSMRFQAALRAWLSIPLEAVGELKPVAALVQRIGLSDAWEARLYSFGSPTRPYKFELMGHMPNDAVAGVFIDNPSSFWPDVAAWDATAERTTVAESLKRLVTFLQERQIAVAIVNMPERSVAGEAYKFDYSQYLGAISDGIGSAPFLDLRNFSRDGEFHDLEHTLPQGSMRLTDRVIDWVRPMISAELNLQ